jgi:hypothetical protein
MAYMKGIKIKWIYAACYEIILPDGTAVNIFVT